MTIVNLKSMSSSTETNTKENIQNINEYGASYQDIVNEKTVLKAADNTWSGINTFEKELVLNDISEPVSTTNKLYSIATSILKWSGKIIALFSGSLTSGNLLKSNGSGNIVDAGVSVSTDGTYGSNSDAKLSTEKANKTYADTKIPLSQKGAANGVATLDSNSLIPIAQIPPAALERLITVADQTARYALTTSSIQNGDTVKQNDTGEMYYVKDDSNLNNSSGYAIYTAGTASAVAWSGITGIPSPVSGLTGSNSGDETDQRIGTLINGSGAETVIADGDLFSFADISVSNILKKITWANIKAVLKTYFDGLYTPTITVYDMQASGNFNSISSANAAADTLTMSNDLFQTGDLFIPVGGSIPTPLYIGTFYYVTRISSGVIKLSEDANAFAVGTFVNITASGTGTAYRASVKPASSAVTKPDIVAMVSTNTTAPFAGIILPLAANIYDGYSVEATFYNHTGAYPYFYFIIQPSDFTGGKVFFQDNSIRWMWVAPSAEVTPFDGVSAKAVYSGGKWILITGNYNGSD